MKNKTFSDDTKKELFRRIKIINIIKEYKKEQINQKEMGFTFRLPQLNKSNSKKNIITKKNQKNNLFGATNRLKFFDERVNNNDLTSRYNRFKINQRKNQTSRGFDKIRKNINRNKMYYKNINNSNYHNELSKLSYYSNYNEESNFISSNRGKKYKIRNFENSKMMFDDFNKINNDFFFQKNNNNIRKNNPNRDIFNLLIDTHNFNLTNIINSKIQKK